MVDLGFSYPVAEVSIVSRSCGSLCGQFLKAFRIMIGTVNSNRKINKHLIEFWEMLIYIDRGYYMAARRYAISLRVLKNISVVRCAHSWYIFNTIQSSQYNKRCFLLYFKIEVWNWLQAYSQLYICINRKQLRPSYFKTKKDFYRSPNAKINW